MAQFKHYLDYLRFVDIVTAQRRFIHPEFVSKFLEAIEDSNVRYTRRFEAGQVLWRAQLGCDCRPTVDVTDVEVIEERPIPYERGRMIPEAKHVREGGRANPPNIPYLYLSADRETAMAEVRPSLNQYISVARFQLVRDCSIIDVGDEKAPPRKDNPENWTPEQRETLTWIMISDTFQRPIVPEELPVGYIPTQVLAEKFLSLGFAGIRFRSAMRPGGVNFVLFDQSSVECSEIELYKTEQIHFVHSQVKPSV